MVLKSVASRVHHCSSKHIPAFTAFTELPHLSSLYNHINIPKSDISSVAHFSKNIIKFRIQIKINT